VGRKVLAKKIKLYEGGTYKRKGRGKKTTIRGELEEAIELERSGRRDLRVQKGGGETLGVKLKRGGERGLNHQEASRMKKGTPGIM